MKSLFIQVKAVKQYLLVVRFILLYKMVLTSKFVDEIFIQRKAVEQYFAVVLFIILCDMVLSFESVYEILKCDHSNESY